MLGSENASGLFEATTNGSMALLSLRMERLFVVVLGTKQSEFGTPKPWLVDLHCEVMKILSDLSASLETTSGLYLLPMTALFESGMSKLGKTIKLLKLITRVFTASQQLLMEKLYPAVEISPSKSGMYTQTGLRIS